MPLAFGGEGDYQKVTKTIGTDGDTIIAVFQLHALHMKEGGVKG
jgi:hypothetical protein